jgi:hypothetical protein
MFCKNYLIDEYENITVPLISCPQRMNQTKGGAGIHD